MPLGARARRTPGRMTPFVRRLSLSVLPGPDLFHKPASCAPATTHGAVLVAEVLSKVEVAQWSAAPFLDC